VGLGLEFLRHIERAGILVHLVEPAPLDGTQPAANYRTLRAELEKFNADLLSRPEIVAVTKADLPEAKEVRRQLAQELGVEVLLISAVTGQGLNDLVAAIARQLPGGTPGW
jgi:GTP-binding protein